MKYIVIIVVAFLISGCSVDYTLEINEKNEIHEEILVKASNFSESKALSSNEWPIKVYYDAPDVGENPEKIEGVSYYVDETFLENNYYQKKLTYSYNFNQFSKVNSIRSCYEHFYVSEDENMITLSTSSEFLCFNTYENLNRVSVSIALPQEVVSHNANHVVDGVYHWDITMDNYDMSGIVLSFIKQEEEKKEEVIPSSKIVLAVSLIVLFLIFIVILIFYQARKNNR